jgi:hypothetical protein
MKTIKIIGAILIITGFLWMFNTSFNLITVKKGMDLSSIRINPIQKHSFHWSPVAGAILILGSVVIIVTGRRISE